MALRINTNVAGMQAQRNLGITTLGLNRSLARLSSGMRINRAADDAAGLAISETMKAQIGGLQAANGNAQDAINLIQTAEGGLSATTDMLHRMRELAVQASNDTYTLGDRAKIQEEIEQLKVELTRSAQTTQYNGRNLLDGSIGRATAAQAATSRVTNDSPIGTPGATQSLINALGTPYWGNGAPGPVTTNLAIDLRIEDGLNPGEIAIHVLAADGTDFYIDDFNGPGGGGPFQGVAIGLNMNNNVALQLTFGNGVLSSLDIGKTISLEVTAGRVGTASDKALSFQIGANEGQTVAFGLDDMTADGLSLETATVVGSTDMLARLNASSLIGAADEALRRVNTSRARLGAMQNRLEHTINNLNVANENLAASNSRIRDTDVAHESAQLTRLQILSQVGTAMLAQANAGSQNVLSLLRS
ncbi:MAG: flagellin [Candidatus Sericytochromatia bacterium]|nr:flagellin [Candidatus Sericytochromatia bacterium]